MNKKLVALMIAVHCSIGAYGRVDQPDVRISVNSQFDNCEPEKGKTQQKRTDNQKLYEMAIERYTSTKDNCTIETREFIKSLKNQHEDPVLNLTDPQTLTKSIEQLGAMLADNAVLVEDKIKILQFIIGVSEAVNGEIKYKQGLMPNMEPMKKALDIVKRYRP
ncbi:MAG: hypothetical protein LBP31_00980 [Holosporales bacterium]|jgi:hypothetical protein|nr:hypothetical protein [Holosporales bacterium]